MEVFGSRLIDLVELRLLASLGFGSGGEGYPRLLGEKTQRFTEADALLFHNQRKSIASGVAATEAVPALLVRIDEERGVFLAVQGAEPPEVTPRLD